MGSEGLGVVGGTARRGVTARSQQPGAELAEQTGFARHRLPEQPLKPRVSDHTSAVKARVCHEGSPWAKTRQAQKIKRKGTKPEAELQASRGLQVSGLPPSHGKPLVVSYAREKVSQPPPTGPRLRLRGKNGRGKLLHLVLIFSRWKTMHPKPETRSPRHKPPTLDLGGTLTAPSGGGEWDTGGPSAALRRGAALAPRFWSPRSSLRLPPLPVPRPQLVFLISAARVFLLQPARRRGAAALPG